MSLGLNEELLQDTSKYLELLAKNKPEKVTLLGLASVKDDIGNYLINYCDPALFTPFTKLRVQYIFDSKEFLYGHLVYIFFFRF